MAKGSWTQSNFLGGVFSPEAGGRIDLPAYKTALAECTNMYPIEEGAVTRRPGTMFIGPTYEGLDGAIYPFRLSQTNSYVIEFTSDGTDIWQRAYTDGHLITDGTHALVTSISTGSPAQIVAPATWTTGDTIVLQVQASGLPTAQTTMWSPIVNRQLKVTFVTTNTYTLTDAVSGANINGAGFTGALPVIHADRVTRNQVPAYAGPAGIIQEMRPTLAQDTLIFVNVGGSTGISQNPLVLSVVDPPTATADPTFTTAAATFMDGPYLDYDIVDTPFTASGQTGTITVTVGGVTQINGGLGFVSTDVGRDIRIVQTVGYWSSGTVYSTGNVVAWPVGASATAYTALPTSTTNVAFEPDTNPAYWAPYPNGVVYSWGLISSINSTTSVQVALQVELPGTSTTNPIIQIALGQFYTDLWPIACVFFEGRLLFGSGESVIASATNGYDPPAIYMQPTDGYGNVLDSSGFNFTLLSPDENSIFWMHPDSASIVVGTAGSEWQIQASALGDPLTPTSFQAHQVTRLGSVYALPVRPGIAITFVNRYSQRLIEYLSDPFTSKYAGKPINVYSQHLGTLGQLEYQDAPTPIIWSIGNNGASLLSCTYRRVSYFASEMPAFYGWAEHFLGAAWDIDYIANAYSSDGSLDMLYLQVTNGAYRAVGYLTPPFNSSSTLAQAQFVDLGMTGISYAGPPYRYDGIYAVSDGNGNIYFNGLYYLAGNSVSVFFGGLDFGDHTVSAAGVVGPIPYSSDTGALGAQAYLTAQSVAANTPGAIPFQMNEGGGGIFYVPGVIGFGYTSTVQRLRPDDPVAARVQTGTGAGQLKRHHWYSMLPTAAVTGTINVSGGDAFDDYYPAVFYQGGVAVTTGVLFSGVHRDTIDSNENLDGQPIMYVNRPVPFTLASWSGFIDTVEL